MFLPEKFTEKMKKLLQDEYEAYIQSFEEPRYYGLRVNTGKIQTEQLKSKVPFQLTPIPWCKEGFYFEQDDRPSKHPYYYAGLYYIQEPSAMAPGAILDIQPQDRVLDLCAAPGGKSTQLAAKLKGQGVLVSNDISTGRVKALLKNIELAGITNAIITNETPERLSQRFLGYFDKILIDAPCSGEGMFRKEPTMIKSWEQYGSANCCRMQRDILHEAAKMLCHGGMLLYSTCTFSPEENEGMIGEFLDANRDFDVIPIPKEHGLTPGRPDFIEERAELQGCARLWPHKVKGEGHFLALLQKRNNHPIKEVLFPLREIDRQILVDFDAFIKSYLHIIPQGDFELHGQGVYLLPPDIPDLRGLRIVRSGWYLGDVKKKRFEPSQAMAMGLKKEEAKYTVNFDLEDPRVIRYLKGETMEVEGEAGWNLVCVDGHPIGWGKIQGHMMKNKILPGWKWE